MTSRIEPSMVAYAVACIVLSLNLMALWGYSGAARAKSKAALNPEDAVLFGGNVASVDPPEVARVLRAHANAQAVIYPFLLLGLVFVLVGGGLLPATILFTIFAIARIGHSMAYLAGRQPWRSLFFIVSVLAMVALMIAIGWRLAAT